MPDQDWPSPTPRDEMLGRVVARGRHLVLINRLLIGLAALAVAASAAIGITLGVTGTVDVLADEPATVSLDRVALRHCPGGDTVGHLRRGDRVLLTGVDESGAWLELRSPYDASERLWIRDDLAVPDETIDDLPERGCGFDEYALTLPDGEQVVGTTSTTVPDESTTTTTGPDGETTTTRPRPGQTTSTTQGPGPTTPTTTPTTSPTTQPPDNTDPVIGELGRTNADINEWTGEFCVYPTSTQLRVAVSDASPVTVTARWSYVGGGITRQGQKQMTLSGGLYRVTVGLAEFGGTLAPADVSKNINWSVRAVDSNGNDTIRYSNVNSAVTLHDCS
ncbi:MAG: hypothetical protein ACSLFP_11860 [Acidimicrobiales bacterium]